MLFDAGDAVNVVTACNCAAGVFDDDVVDIFEDGFTFGKKLDFTVRAPLDEEVGMVGVSFGKIVDFTAIATFDTLVDCDVTKPADG